MYFQLPHHRHSITAPLLASDSQLPLQILRPKQPIKLGQPPLQGVALWLLNKYPNLRFPNGRIFWTSTTEFFPTHGGDSLFYLTSGLTGIWIV